MTQDSCSETSGCAELAALDRRSLLRAGAGMGAAALLGTTTLFGATVVTARPATAVAGGSALVVLSLRGAADGLSLVVPYGDPVLADARRGITIAPDRLLVGDGFFGLHPALAPLLPLWQSGGLAAIHATGLPAPNRSHFAAMEEIEDADPGSSTRSGWLNRLVGELPGESALQGFFMGEGVLPASMVGRAPVFAAGTVDAVSLLGERQAGFRTERSRSLHRIWDDQSGPLGSAMQRAFTAIDGVAPAQREPSGASAYPDTDLGRALADVARLLRADIGVDVVTVDHGDWDMHTNVGDLRGGRMLTQATELASGLGAFLGDLDDRAAAVTVVVLSEFGRRITVNTNRGLDHGHGNVMLVCGAGVKGGYYADWPGLEAHPDADLPVTTDYRQVLAEIVAARFPTARLTSVFPGLVRRPVGFMRTA